MSKKVTAIAGVLACFGMQAAMAQSLVGGSISYEYRKYEDQQSHGALAMSGELALSRNFSIQGDLGYQLVGRGAGGSLRYSSSAALHGIYHINNNASVGAFVGRTFTGNGATIYGLEVGGENGQFHGEAAVSWVDSTFDSTSFELDLGYDLTEQLTVRGGLIYSDVKNSGSLRVTELGADYAFNDSFSIGGSFGARTQDNKTAPDVTQNYFALTAEMKVGSSRGATFERRETPRSFGF